jgi:hypothetical protein
MTSPRASRIEVIEEIPIAELVEEKVDKPAQEIFIDKGLPIPSDYDIDAIRALVQDPFHIWVYWEMREGVFGGLLKIFPPAVADSFQPVLKITELTLGHTAFIDIEKKGDYWLNVFPDRRYRIEVGLRSPQRGYIRVLESDEVRTPRGTISMVVAEEPEYKISNQEFVDTLRNSGFDAFTEIIGPERVLRTLPPQVSDVISTAAAGEELTEEQMASLPARIRALLLEMREQGGGALTTLALLHMLPEYLREALSKDEGIFYDSLHPHHVAPRFMVGSSETRPHPGRKPWMPSMSDRPTSPTRPAPKTYASE